MTLLNALSYEHLYNILTISFQFKNCQSFRSSNNAASPVLLQMLMSQQSRWQDGTLFVLSFTARYNNYHTFLILKK